MGKKRRLATAFAALELCEALLLTLIEKGVLTRDEAVSTLESVREVKETEARERGNPGARRAAADIIQSIIISIEHN